MKELIVFLIINTLNLYFSIFINRNIGKNEKKKQNLLYSYFLIFINLLLILYILFYIYKKN